MVSKSVFKKLFPGKAYVESNYDDQPEPAVLPLAVEGVVNSLDRMATIKVAPYLPEINQLLGLEITIPAIVPNYDEQPSGWSKLSTLEPVDLPPNAVRVIDVETLVKCGSVPVMAVALGVDGVYIWKTPELGALIDIGNQKLTIGHNVSYDMARFSEPYQGLGTELYCLDTMTLSTLVSGFCSSQYWAEFDKSSRASLPIWAYKGFGKSNFKSLGDAFKFYCRGSKMMAPDKSIREKFVEATSIDDLVDDWSHLLLYNILDVLYTLQVFQKVYPLWLTKAPHPTSLYGLMCSGFYRIPLHPEFDKWAQDTDNLYHKMAQEITEALEVIALEWVNSGPDADCPWKSQLDWSGKIGYPKWYRKAKSGKNPNITLKSQLSPLLLKLTFDGLPVSHSKGKGWHNKEESVPHPSGSGNVGYLFSKNFVGMFENGMLKSHDDRCQGLLDKAIGLSYWTSVRSRVFGVVHHNNWALPEVGGGTVTGRVTDPLWLTTCDPKKHLLGSELKSRIKAPPGYKLLVADFSSQEMRIAWSLGDARVGKVGGTPMSISGIKGSKEDKTDAHSMTASKISTLVGKPYPRQEAKVINFAMLYMAGVKTVSSYIRQVLPEVSIEEAKRFAKDTLEYRRGKVTYNDSNREYTGGTDSETYTAIDQIACSPRPRTPLLSREIPDPLCPLYCGSDFYTTRANWTIQATARDQLDCLTTAFNYMATMCNLEAKIIWSRHDEVIVLAPESEVTLASELLQQAHIFTWAALHEKLGLYDLPSHGLLFDEINVDTVCRKEVDKAISTPSLIDLEPNGYYIKPGQIKGFNQWAELINR